MSNLKQPDQQCCRYSSVYPLNFSESFSPSMGGHVSLSQFNSVTVRLTKTHFGGVTVDRRSL